MQNKCIVNISGIPAFISDKYPTFEHPNYKYLADADERNRFDFAKYRKRMEKKENPANMEFRKDDEYWWQTWHRLLM